MATISNTNQNTYSISGVSTTAPLGSISIGGTGSGGITGGTGSYILSNGAGATYANTWIKPADGVLTVTGNPSPSLDVKGNVVINGRDLEERLSIIEKVLQIPERDVKLEKKYPKLKELYDAYIHALGKYRTFEAIKGEDND